MEAEKKVIREDVKQVAEIELGLEHFRNNHHINEDCPDCKGEGHLGKVAEGKDKGRYKKCPCAKPIPKRILRKKGFAKLKFKQKAMETIAERKRLALGVKS